MAGEGKHIKHVFQVFLIVCSDERGNRRAEEWGGGANKSLEEEYNNVHDPLLY